MAKLNLESLVLPVAVVAKRGAVALERIGSGSSAGVSVSRRSAITAGQTILSGWSPITGGTAMATRKRHHRHLLMTAKMPMRACWLLSGYPQTGACLTASTPTRELCWSRGEQGEKHVLAERTSTRFGSGMPSGSTRGR